jgi:hypothetical protein
MAHYVHRPQRLGSSVLISADWYKPTGRSPSGRSGGVFMRHGLRQPLHFDGVTDAVAVGGLGDKGVDAGVRLFFWMFGNEWVGHGGLVYLGEGILPPVAGCSGDLPAMIHARRGRPG